MSFRWNPRIPDEWKPAKPPPLWVYVALGLLIEAVFLGCTIATWPHGKPVDQDFMRTALAAPFAFWVTVCAVVYVVMHEQVAFEAAVKNRARWHLIRDWQKRSRAGVAVLDSVVLAPEPNLALRMLNLEGTPPENSGRVMALDGTDAAEGVPRARQVLTQLLTPLAATLKRSEVRSETFDIVLQCGRSENALDVQAVWEQMKLPGCPRVRWLDSDHDIGLADRWFEDDWHAFPYSSYGYDCTPKYRLLLAWHLNGIRADETPSYSEAAVALLFGSAALLAEKPGIRPQAWLLRQSTGDADQVGHSLAWLLNAEQVPRERIHHFWHARLKGIARHATLGAVRDSDLKVEEHALEAAVGPQAPVARWLLAALATKVAHFGQGPQLVALPYATGVAVNLVVKEPTPVNMPWKEEYDYNRFPVWEFVGLVAMWTALMLMSPDKSWGALETASTAVIVAALLVAGVGRLLAPRAWTDDVWRKYG